MYKEEEINKCESEYEVGEHRGDLAVSDYNYIFLQEEDFHMTFPVRLLKIFCTAFLEKMHRLVLVKIKRLVRVHV
jgi:hypothetical protein